MWVCCVGVCGGREVDQYERSHLITSAYEQTDEGDNIQPGGLEEFAERGHAKGPWMLQVEKLSTHTRAKP